MITSHAGSVLVRDTLALQCQGITRLGSFLNMNGLLTVDRNDLYICTKRCLGECDRYFTVGVVALSLDDRMRFNTELDIECSVWAAAKTRLTFTGDREHIARIDTGRDMNLEFFLNDCASSTTAIRARILDDRSSAVTCRTVTCDHRHTEECLCLLLDASASLTCGTCFRLRSRRCTRSLTYGTGVLFVDRNGLIYAERRFHELERHIVLEIGTTYRSVVSSSAAAKSTAEERSEDISEIDCGTRESGEALSIDTGMTELVVVSSLFCVRKDRVRFVTFLELRFRFLIARMQVRVILLGHFTVCLFEFVLRDILVYAQDLIIISLLFSQSLVPPLSA